MDFHYLENKLKEHIDIKIFNQDTLKTLNLYNVQIGYNNAANILSDNNSFPGIDIAKFGDSINIIKKRLLLENMMLLSKRIEIIINMKKLKAATVKRSILYQKRHSVNLLQTHSFIEHGI